VQLVVEVVLVVLEVITVLQLVLVPMQDLAVAAVDILVMVVLVLAVQVTLQTKLLAAAVAVAVQQVGNMLAVAVVELVFLEKAQTELLEHVMPLMVVRAVLLAQMVQIHLYSHQYHLMVMVALAVDTAAVAVAVQDLIMGLVRLSLEQAVLVLAEQYELSGQAQLVASLQQIRVTYND
jgi:hypothetical protein